MKILNLWTLIVKQKSMMIGMMGDRWTLVVKQRSMIGNKIVIDGPLQILGNIFFTNRNMYTAHERRYIEKLVDIHDNYYKMTKDEIEDVLYK